MPNSDIEIWKKIKSAWISLMQQMPFQAEERREIMKNLPSSNFDDI